MHTTPNNSSKSNLNLQKQNRSEEGFKKVYQENGRPIYIKKNEFNQHGSLSHVDSRHHLKNGDMANNMDILKKFRYNFHYWLKNCYQNPENSAQAAEVF